ATGKLVVLASLMLQLVTCGGTYPIQTEPQLLQSLSPYLPMTWSVNALRMLFTGGADERVLYAVIVLVAFLAGSLLISSLRATQMRTWNLTRLHPVLTVG
ncbi:MAG: YhgE/Pip domain-containing protein, partial [Propionibacteriaceae bacterium]|nr:YhgE/Pip domain-containing protein [Propionibacteriaceae bacterium]